jgi:hypothetical protein
MTINVSGSVQLGGSTAGESIAYELGLNPTSSINLNSANIRRLANKPTLGSTIGMGDVRGQGARVEFVLSAGSGLEAFTASGIAVATSNRLGAVWALTYVQASTGANSFAFNIWSNSVLPVSGWADTWKIIRVSDNALMKDYTASGSAATWASQPAVTNVYYGAGFLPNVSFNTNVSAFAAGVTYAFIFN